jgi:putative glutamine amidotransferase
MSQPIIGLTTSQVSTLSRPAETKLADAYIQAVIDAGGTPLLIPNHIPDKALGKLCSRLDGLLFTGGGDIHPERYGGKVHERVYSINLQRDHIEITLFQEARRIRLPFLGICRGIQVINVACGGTLYEDICDQHPEALKHDYYPDWSRDHLAHEVDIDPNSQLSRVLDQSQVRVNSLHHQAVREVSPDLVIVAHAPDGIVEGIELPGHPFGMAVQWHPECLQAYQAMRALFTNFVAAAGYFRNGDSVKSG